MKVSLHQRFLLLFLSTIAGLTISVLRSDEVVLDPSAASAELVQAALESEFIGDLVGRSEKLKRAIAIQPNCPEARWHSGHVRTGNDWRTVEEHEARCRQDEDTAVYVQRRDQLRLGDGSHATVARWCEARGMKDRAHLHWQMQLALEPDNPEALKALNYVPFGETMLPLEQATALEQASKDYASKLNQWGPQIADIRRLYRATNKSKREQGSEALHAIHDPAAIPAMEALLSPDRDLALEVLTVLDKIPTDDAVDSLVRHTLYAEPAEVRERAAKLLQSRDPYAFVPTLISSMTWPIRISTFRDGTGIGITLMQENAEQIVATRVTERRVHTRHMFSVRLGRSGNQINMTYGSKRSPLIGALLNAVPQQNRAIAVQSRRATEALGSSTGQKYGNNPEAWREWWDGQNEISSYGKKKPIIPRNYTHVSSSYSVLQVSCFAAGTPVWTETGPRPVESIQPGDRVLSQDSTTGELTYKLVTNTTVRPAIPTKKIFVDGEPITATPGHPIWVVRKGWRMVKEIKPGDWLHTLRGASTVEQIEEGAACETYNLVVDDFHTYFVGPQRILVHDNMVRNSMPAVVPGLVEG